VLVIPALIYLLLTTGSASAKLPSLPWSVWVQLAIDSIFLVFWLAAGAVWVKDFTCNDLCGFCARIGEIEASAYEGYYHFGSSCNCRFGEQVFADFRKLANRATTASEAGAVKALGKISRKTMKLGLDWVLL
jgi:hypothetical protein